MSTMTVSYKVATSGRVSTIHLSLPAMNTSDITSPPFVVVDGIANFRDIGGYPTFTGQLITKGLAFRCADPSKATREGLEKMSQDLGKVKLTCY
jgi:hypothetical protein